MNPLKSHGDVNLAAWRKNVSKALSFAYGFIMLPPLSKTQRQGPGCGLEGQGTLVS